jgi:hypothetical protein
MKGGGDFDYTDMKNDIPREKAEAIAEEHGNPDLVERRDDKIIKLTWFDVEGLDELVIHNKLYKKYTPVKMEAFVEGRRLITVPPHLMGPITYMSPTVSVDNIHITGKKSMVSCTDNTITACAITLKLIEDECSRLAQQKLAGRMFAEIRDKYKRHILYYLRGNGLPTKIPWYKNELEAEEEKHNHIKSLRKRRTKRRS